MVTIRLVILTNLALYFFNICDFGGFFLFFVGLILTCLFSTHNPKKQKNRNKRTHHQQHKNLSGVVSQLLIIISVFKGLISLLSWTSIFL